LKFIFGSSTTGMDISGTTITTLQQLHTQKGVHPSSCPSEWLCWPVHADESGAQEIKETSEQGFNAKLNIIIDMTNASIFIL